MENIKPNWLTRNGTQASFLVLVLLTIIAFFIRYPDSVTAQGKLTGTNAPKPVMAKQTGRLERLYKKNGEEVEAGEIIGVLESTASITEVLRFSQQIDDIHKFLQENDTSSVRVLMKKNFNNLGELQGDYQVFMQAYIPYQNYVLGDYAFKKKMFLYKDIENVNSSRRVLNRQKELYEEDYNLNKITLEKSNKLLRDSIISEQEYRELISQNINKKMFDPQMESSYLGNAAQINNIKKEITDLNKEIATQDAIFHQVVYNMKSKVDEWKSKFLLEASESGRLAFTSFLQENQIITAGKVVFFVIPSNSEIYVEGKLKQYNFGKVKNGQKVLLNMPAYPAHEYGKLTGKIEYISPVPVDSGYYLVKIILPNYLETNYNRQLPFVEGLSAESEIITEDISLAESLYYDVIKKIKK